MLVTSKFFNARTADVARKLVGCFLEHRTKEGTAIGRIVEAEAYLCDDPACHAYGGCSRRNEAMFGPPGTAYIYFIYGVHYCFNVVTNRPGIGEAVLIRALEPVEGIDLMRRRRKVERLESLCSGPGKLVAAMGIEPGENGLSLLKGNFRLHTRSSFRSKICPQKRRMRIGCSRRVGITKAADLPLRFYIEGSPFLSVKVKSAV